MPSDHPCPGSPSLLCRDLDLPQQVAIWFVRRAFHDGTEATERTARKVFGAAAMETALGALEVLVDCLHRSPLDTGPVHPLRERVQSTEEYDLLTALAASQHAGAEAAQRLALCWGWPAAIDVERVPESLAAFAARLEHAGQRLPAPQGRRLLGCAATDSIAGLDCRERALVDGMRLWVRCVKEREPALPALEALLQEHRLGTAARSLDAILTNTATAATRQVDVRCPGCTGLAADEARIVLAVAAAQRRQQALAFELLAAWLAPAAVRLTLPAVEGLAASLAAAFHRLPLRGWRFPELASPAAATAPPAGTPHKALLH